MSTPKKTDETPEAVEVTPEAVEVTPEAVEVTPEVMAQVMAEVMAQVMAEAMEVSPPPYDPIENHPELLAELQNPTTPPEERRFAGQTHVDGLTNSGVPVKIPV